MSRLLALATAALLLAAARGAAPVPEAADPARYDFREEHSRDGIGKFYLGREIAQVMGHQAAEWLERPEREQEEHTAMLMELLRIRPGEVVADIGCGTGYISRRLARKVGARGLVLAEDIQPEMLDLLSRRMAQLGIENVKSVLGTTTDPRLPPAAVDVVLMVDVYHEFDCPWEMMDAIVRSLQPEGRVIFVEYRGEDPTVPIKALHKMTVAQVRREMSVFPLDWVETIDSLPRQHVIVFRKRSSAK